MEFLPPTRGRSSSRNVPSGKERGETDVFAGYLLQEPLHSINRPFIPLSLFDILGLLWVVMVTRCVVRSNMQWGEAMK